jgi:hypothetical protein
MKYKIFIITFLFFCLITTVFPNTIALDNYLSESEKTEKNQLNIDNLVNNQLTEKAIIIGEVKVAMTCVPTPLEGAKVYAIRMIPLGCLFAKYEAITDINGEYLIEVNTGFYRVFVREKGYLQFNPFFFYLIRVESGQIHNCSFILREGGFPIKIIGNY